ncbi:helix-turn-helix domain-containing protein [Halocalculus aciditolerans]
MAGLASQIASVQSIELDNAFYVEDGKWIESLTISATDPFDIEEAIGGISGATHFFSREVPSGPTNIHVRRVTLLANESYPFILGLVLRAEAIPNRIVWTKDIFEVVLTTRTWEEFRGLADEIKEALGMFDLLSVNQIESPGEPLDSGRLTEVMVTKLANEQLETLETAYTMGYFEVPREASATDVADELGVAQSTMSERLRTAERNLLEIIYGPQS